MNKATKSYTTARPPRGLHTMLPSASRALGQIDAIELTSRSSQFISAALAVIPPSAPVANDWDEA